MGLNAYPGTVRGLRRECSQYRKCGVLLWRVAHTGGELTDLLGRGAAFLRRRCPSREWHLHISPDDSGPQPDCLLRQHRFTAHVVQ